MPEPYADYPEIIHESGQDLLLLVDDILDLAKAEADRQRLEPEPVDLTASAQSILRQLDNQAERAGVKLKLKASGEVWAEADARAVRQIWQNLVSNAIKYSSSGGTVTLDARDEGNATVLSGTDKGAGMSAEDVRRVLEPFSQGSNSKGRQGTGLGLAVVHSFAQLHGGQVVIDCAPGKGTKVEVSLPRANPADIQPLEDAAE
jgi:cell cycle sensor histidine kinase DivJ